MKVELITIGNEVLSGHTVNTNATVIAQELFKEGYKLSRETTIVDEELEISQAILAALDRSDFVITTGGLGPTLDDISGSVAEKTLKSSPELLKNNLGSAPGLIFRQGQHALAMLPGVPHEMKAMLVDSVIPVMKKSAKLEKRPFRQVLSFTTLYETAVDPLLRDFKEKYPELEFGIYPSLGLLQVHLYVYADSQENADRLIDPAAQILKDKFAANYYESETGNIGQSIQSLFTQKGWTLSAAESCTGGSIASYLTQISGASAYFLGSVVSYSNEAKESILGVSPQTIEKFGAVSKETVTEMVLGASKVFKSDFSIAVTGIAGPTGGTEEKPVGTVWFAIHRKGNEPLVWKIQRKGNREMIITGSKNILLGKLYHYAKNEI